MTATIEAIHSPKSSDISSRVSSVPQPYNSDEAKQAEPIPAHLSVPEAWIVDFDNTNGPTLVCCGTNEVPNPDVITKNVSTYEPLAHRRAYMFAGAVTLRCTDK